jgi:ankyrin repeat protein
VWQIAPAATTTGGHRCEDVAARLSDMPASALLGLHSGSTDRCTSAVLNCPYMQGDDTNLFCRHLAAAEGCYAVVQWLLHDAGAKPNPIDRFGRTPLEDAVCLLVI